MSTGFFASTFGFGFLAHSSDSAIAFSSSRTLVKYSSSRRRSPGATSLESRLASAATRSITLRPLRTRPACRFRSAGLSSMNSFVNSREGRSSAGIIAPDSV